MAHILNILAKVKEDVETLASTAEIIVEETLKGKTLNRDEGYVVQGLMGSKKTVTNEPTTARKYQIQTLHKMPHLETVTSKENRSEVEVNSSCQQTNFIFSFYRHNIRNNIRLTNSCLS